MKKLNLNELRCRIYEIEQREGVKKLNNLANTKSLSFGIKEIDSHLPSNGLTLGVLHQFLVPRNNTATLGFLVALLSKLSAQAPGFIFWFMPFKKNYSIYGPGLKMLGLNPSRIIFIEGRKSQNLLWGVHESLSCPYLLAVVAEVNENEISWLISRKLQLASEKSGVSCFLLSRKQHTLLKPSAAFSRWWINSLSSNFLNNLELKKKSLSPNNKSYWILKLERCRGTSPSEWKIEWHYETHNFNMVSISSN